MEADSKDPDQLEQLVAQSDQGLHCQLQESVNIIEYMYSKGPKI